MTTKQAIKALQQSIKDIEMRPMRFLGLAKYHQSLRSLDAQRGDFAIVEKMGREYFFDGHHFVRLGPARV